MTDHLPAGGLPRSPDDHETPAPDVSKDTEAGEPSSSLTATGELLAEAFPDLDPEMVARTLGLNIQPTRNDDEGTAL